MITTPTTDRGRATVGRVLDAACALFVEKGVRATTLDEICAAASVGRSQLYHFFADKSDLVADVVVAQAKRLLASVRPALETMVTVADLVAICDDVVATYGAGPRPIRCPLGSLIHQLDAREDAAAWTALKQGFAEWESLLAAGLQRVLDGAGAEAASTADQLATGFLAAYQGGVLIAEVTGDVEPLRRALHMAVAALPVQP